MCRDDGTFILDVDASDIAAGAVLQQEQEGMEKVIGYASKSFDKHERNYCTTRKELAALVFGLKNYRQYLLGRKFKIRTDHAALQYLKSATELFGQQARWLDLICEFDFTLSHRAGLSHGNADGLSRIPPCERRLNGQTCPQCYKKFNKQPKFKDDIEIAVTPQGAVSVPGPHAYRAMASQSLADHLAISKQRRHPKAPAGTARHRHRKRWKSYARAVSTRAQKRREEQEEGQALPTVMEDDELLIPPLLEKEIELDTWPDTWPDTMPDISTSYAEHMEQNQQRRVEENTVIATNSDTETSEVDDLKRGDTRTKPNVHPDLSKSVTSSNLRTTEELDEDSMPVLLENYETEMRDLLKTNKGPVTRSQFAQQLLKATRDTLADPETQIYQDENDNSTTSVLPKKRGRPKRVVSTTTPLPQKVPGQNRTLQRRQRRDRDLDIFLAPWTPELLSQEQETDISLSRAKEWVKNGECPEAHTIRRECPALKAYHKQFKSLFIEDDVLKRRIDSIDNMPAESQIVLPMHLRKKFLQIVHQGVAGHLGSYKTRTHVGSRAYWYMWREDTDNYCKSCDVCTDFYRNKVPPKQGKLHPLVVGFPLELWGVDLAGQFRTTTTGYEYILTALDLFSKFIVLVPLRDKTALTVANALWNHVFLKFGVGTLLCDRGLEFKNSLLDEVSRLMGTSRAYTTSYEARTNGQTERSHQTGNSMLAKCTNEHQTDWDQYLAGIAFCHNAATHESTKRTPFYLLHGFQPRWDCDIQLGTMARHQYSVNDYANLLVTRLEIAHEIARQNLHRSAQSMKDGYNKRVEPKEFEEGQTVKLLNLRIYPGLTPKIQQKYRDRGVIEQKINDVTYRVKCETWIPKSRIIHVDKLRKIHEFELAEKEPYISDLDNQPDSEQQECDSETAALSEDTAILKENEIALENGKNDHSVEKKSLCLLTDQSEVIQRIEKNENAASSGAGIQSQ